MTKDEVQEISLDGQLYVEGRPYLLTEKGYSKLNNYYRAGKLIFMLLALLYIYMHGFSMLREFLLTHSTSPDSFGREFLGLLFTFLIWFGFLSIVTNYISSRQAKKLIAINADKYLDEFDFSIASVKSEIQKDIKVVGYFSALGYWNAKSENDYHLRLKGEDEETKKKRNSLKERYPKVFDSDDNDKDIES